MKGPANHTSAAREPSPTPYNMIRRMFFSIISLHAPLRSPPRPASRVARDHHLDPAVLGTALQRIVAGDRHVRTLAVNVDAARIRQAGLEQGGNRLGPLHGEMPVRG